MTSHDDTRLRAVVVLVSASWSAPSRPAATMLRELDRRCRREAMIETGAGSSDPPTPRVLSLHLEDPTPEEIDAWRLEALPAWLRFARDDADHEDPAPVATSATADAGSDLRRTGRDTPSSERPVRLADVDPSRLRRPASHLSDPESSAGELDLTDLWSEQSRILGAAPKHEIASSLYA